MSRNQLALEIGKSPQTLEKYEAEAPADLIEALERYAISINRQDAVGHLRKSSPEVSQNRSKIELPHTRSYQVESASGPIPVPEADAPWVRKLLQVLHSKKPGLKVAAQNNMDEFVWADSAWNELQSRQSPLVSGFNTASGRSGRAAGELASLTPPGGVGGRGGEAEADLEQTVDALEKAKARSKARKKDDARKSR